MNCMMRINRMQQAKQRKRTRRMTGKEGRKTKMMGTMRRVQWLMCHYLWEQGNHRESGKNEHVEELSVCGVVYFRLR
jgi:hypothetical protein